MDSLKVVIRKEKGKKTANLRAQGYLPAILYGKQVEPTPLSILQKDFLKVWKNAGGSSLVRLDMEGDKPEEKKEYNVLIQDVFQDPVKNIPLHADFYAVDMDKKIRKSIPLEFIGLSSAVKDFGGILVEVLREVEVEALPQNLPHSISIDLSKLANVHDKFFIKDILLPDGVKIHGEPEEVVVVVEAPRTEEELKALETEAEAAPAEVKTEQEINREAKQSETETEDKQEA